MGLCTQVISTSAPCDLKQEQNLKNATEDSDKKKKENTLYMLYNSLSHFTFLHLFKEAYFCFSGLTGRFSSSRPRYCTNMYMYFYSYAYKYMSM